MPSSNTSPVALPAPSAPPPSLCKSTSAPVEAYRPITFSQEWSRQESEEQGSLMFQLDDIEVEQDFSDDISSLTGLLPWQSSSEAASKVLEQAHAFMHGPSAASLAKLDKAAVVQALSDHLQAAGHVVAVVRAPAGGASAWRPAHVNTATMLKQLHNSFVVVAVPGELELVIDPAFRSHFELPAARPRYRALLSSTVPELYVGTRPELLELITHLGGLMADEIRSQGMALPPWRSLQALLSRFIGKPVHGFTTAGPAVATAAFGPFAPAAAAATADDSDSDADSDDGADDYDDDDGFFGSHASSALLGSSGASYASSVAASPKSVLSDASPASVGKGKLFGAKADGFDFTVGGDLPWKVVAGFELSSPKSVKSVAAAAPAVGSAKALAEAARVVEAVKGWGSVALDVQARKQQSAAAATSPAWAGLLPRMHTVRMVGAH